VPYVGPGRGRWRSNEAAGMRQATLTADGVGGCRPAAASGPGVGGGGGRCKRERDRDPDFTALREGFNFCLTVFLSILNCF
jgi:hypothetical protein